MDTEALVKKFEEHISLMTPRERDEAAVSLYMMDLIDRGTTRKLLGVDDSVYNERVRLGSWYTCLEERFDSLPDEFLSGKVMEQLKEYGEC